LLEIAMGLGQDPRLFILDEPTQGLAESEIDDFKTLLRRIAGVTTILLIEHNMDVVMETAEFITVLDMGQKLAEGTPDEIRANKLVQSAYLGTG
jgi:branched-chain amino acid transport system ATP-binding protein